MQKGTLFLIVLLVCGCVGISSQDSSLRHESDEIELLTEAEFMERASQVATRIYEGFRIISDAAEKYAQEHDD